MGGTDAIMAGPAGKGIDPGQTEHSKGLGVPPTHPLDFA